jgi:hypothetical protein
VDDDEHFLHGDNEQVAQVTRVMPHLDACEQPLAAIGHTRRIRKKNCDNEQVAGLQNKQVALGGKPHLVLANSLWQPYCHVEASEKRKNSPPGASARLVIAERTRKGLSEVDHS